MVKSSIYFLSALIIAFTSCEQREWYKKELSEELKKQYSPQVRAGRVYSYQGSVPEQFQLKEAMMLDSTDADLWREFGTARVKRGILDEMYYYYNEAVKRKPEKWAGFRGYLYLYFYRDYERAIADFNLGDEANGQVDYSQGQSHDYMRGICYYGMKDYTTAINFLDRYINKVVEEEGESWVDVYAILYKGLSLLQLERFDEAIIEFDRVLKYYPNLSDCFYHKARIYIARGQFDLALKELDIAEEYFKKGYFHQRPYVEVLEQIYLQDIVGLGREISTS
ncbi:tetratricopeptide repeat protein [Ekhidna sp.]|uniref:tetratricopeptide repeat protein n=1 Tax=Ekhidna sp. TaxID=2608089 RepID=UPI003B5CF8B6